MDTRRFSFKMFAKEEKDNKIPPYKPKTQTHYDKMENWEYRIFKDNPGGKWEKVVDSKNPNTYRIKVKDLPKNTPSKEDNKKTVDESKTKTKKFNQREKYRKLTEDAQTEFDKYYGNTDEKEKRKIEKNAAKQLTDYIEKVSKGEESAEFPDLPSDMKAKFITAMFLLLRSKQLDEIKAPNKVVQKQKDMVVAKIESKAIDALKTVVNHISTKGMVERHITFPKDPESIFKKTETKKPLSKMSDDEFSDVMAGRDEKNPMDFALRRNETRDKELNDMPSESRKNAADISEVIKDYKNNFGKFNGEIGDVVKIKTQNNKIGFVMEGYKASDSDITSNISLPVESVLYNKIATSLTDTIKKLTSNGFKGKIEIETDPEKLLMNKDNIRIISDNIKHTQAASEMLKEVFGKNGIDSSIEMEKKQFGMSQPEQIKYITNLKKLALNSSEKGEFSLPDDEIGKYMIAARLRGYDIVPSGDLYGLRVHAPESPIGQIKLSNSSDPMEIKKTLSDANTKENEKDGGEQYPDIELDNPFEKIKKTMEEYQKDNPEEEYDRTDTEVEYQDDEYYDERVDRMLDRRDSDITEPEQEKIFDTDSYLENTESSEKSIKEKISKKDESVFKDISAFVDENSRAMRDNTVAKAYGDSLINRIKGLYFDLGRSNLNVPDEIQNKIEYLIEQVKDSKNPVPKKENEFDFSKVDGYEKNETPVKLFDWVKSAQVKSDDNHPTGWVLVKEKDKNFIDRYKLISLDGKHTIWGGTKNSQRLKDFANNNPYRMIDEKTWIDPIDYDEKDFDDEDEDIRQGRVLLSNKEADSEKIAKIGESYGIDVKSPVTKELLGFKRLIFKNLSEEDRKEIKEKGLMNYFSSKPSMKTMITDFVQRMNPKNYPDGNFEEMKKKVSGIPPVDFVKMIVGIKTEHTIYSKPKKYL